MAFAFKLHHERTAIKKRNWLLKHGGSNAVLIEDDDVILVRHQNACCAIIVNEQGIESESLRYEWYLRVDGSGRLFGGETAVSKGSVTIGPPTCNTNMHIGPFDLQWSGGDGGFGWFYFPSDPSSSSTSCEHNDYAMLM